MKKEDYLITISETTITRSYETNLELPDGIASIFRKIKGVDNAYAARYSFTIIRSSFFEWGPIEEAVLKLLRHLKNRSVIQEISK